MTYKVTSIEYENDDCCLKGTCACGRDSIIGWVVKNADGSYTPHCAACRLQYYLPYQHIDQDAANFFTVKLVLEA